MWSGVYRGWRGLWHCGGSFTRHLVFADHAPSADILFSFRSDGLDPFGPMGRTWSADGAVGFGVHGGWHANEMSWVGILAGPLTKNDFVSQVPSDICDIAPTVLGLPFRDGQR